MSRGISERSNIATDIYRQSTSFSAQVEIETTSKSPRVMPRSIYTSHQFTFLALPEDHEKQAALGNYANLDMKRVEVRTDVEARQGRGAATTATLGSVPGTSTSPTMPSSDFSASPASFDQPIKSAMQTIIDCSSSPDGVRGRQPQPAGFPNGVAGKSGGGGATRWRNAIPIRSSDVNAGLTQGFSTMRKVGSRAVAVAGATAAHVGRSGAALGAMRLSANSVGEEASSSLSFEDDTVFADRADEVWTESTAGTSERDSCGEVEVGCDDEEPWGELNVTEDRHVDRVDVGDPVADQIARMDIDEPEGLPFGHDFDDLDLALADDGRNAGSKLTDPPGIHVHVSEDTRSIAPAFSVLDADVESEWSPDGQSKAPTLPVPPVPIALDPRVQASTLAGPIVSASPSSVGSSGSAISRSSKKKKKGRG